MTTGIALTNGIETILLCDEMVTAGNRQSASAVKLGEMANGGYHGALVGAGSANLVLGAATAASNKELVGEGLDDFVRQLQGWIEGKLDSYDRRWLSGQMNDAVKKSELIGDEQERLQYLNSERARIWQQFDHYKAEQRQQGGTVQLLLAAHDSKLGKARLFSVSDAFRDEIFLPHVEIGSGADAAQMYFLEMLQGVNTGRLDAAKMLVYVASAYMKSTLNVGVGGTPRIVLIGKEKTDNLSGLVAPLIANVCGYHLAGALTREEVNGIADAAISGVELTRHAKAVSQKLEVGETDLMKATMPLSVIHQRLKPYERY